MAQPPYSPQGGLEPGGEDHGSHGWDPAGATNEPTEPVGAPGEGQRHPTQQFGPPQFGQQPGPSPYGPPPYQGQPYGQPTYGQQYGRSPYGPPPYGPPPYGAPHYGQPQYGQPQYGQPVPPWGAGPQRPKGNTNTVIALIIAGVVVVAAIGVALVLVLGRDVRTRIASSAAAAATSHSSSSPGSSRSTGAGSGIPPAAAPPDGLGDDPILDRYAKSCYDGDMNACDALYNDSKVNSAYETYGGTCAGRQPLSSADVVYCADAFPG